MRVWSSLQTKLTASFVVLVLVVSALGFVCTVLQAQRALHDATQDRLRSTARLIAAELSGADATAMAGLRPGDEDSATFVRIRDHLQGLRAADGEIRYLYTMRRDGDRVLFMVDADYSAADTSAPIGKEYLYDGPMDHLLLGFAQPSVEEEFGTDDWGTVLSAYAPLRGTDGALVGLVGVDMDITVAAAKERFLGVTVFLVAGGGILLASLLVLVFSKTIIRDLRRLTATANAVSQGRMDIDIDVARSDEIGELAQSFDRMVVSLRLMMALGGRTQTEVAPQ